MTEESQEREPVVVEEVIHIEPGVSEAKYGRTQFAAVVFHNIPETYPADAHIECKYTVTSDLVPASRDWVGLYKVGWMSPRDYVYYEWAPCPKDYEIGKEAEASVLFPSHKMPGDDGEFYQFCYVSSSGQIRGASTPFQFKSPSAGDFVELEDEEADMLVIKSKTIYLQENLQHMESEKSQLIKAQGTLQTQRDELVAKLMTLEKKLTVSEASNDDLKKKVLVGNREIEKMSKEAADMVLIHDEMKVKQAALLKDKQELERKIEELNAKIKTLVSVERNLQSEKDQVEGQNRKLTEELDLYKEQFSCSESSAKIYSQQSEELQMKLAENASLITHLEEVKDKLQNELTTEKQKVKEMAEASAADKEAIETLKERLKNTEDRLSAAEETKELLNTEILSYKETQLRLNSEIEESKSESHSLKQKLVRMEEDFTQKCDILKCEVESKDEDLKAALEEKNRAQEEICYMQQHLDNSQDKCEASLSSMTIMKTTLEDLKTRLDKKDKSIRSLETALAKSQREFQQKEQDLVRENEDLKERILMCGEEYKTLYVEKSKIQKQLDRILERKRARMERQTSEKSVKDTDKPEVEVVQPLQSASDVSLTEGAEEIEKQMDDFGRELDARLEKKIKYKKLYMDEKAKTEDLRKNYVTEVRQKDEVIGRLRKLLDEKPGHLDLKVRSMEKLVTEKEGLIKQLEGELREAQSQIDELRIAGTPRKELKMDKKAPAEGKYPCLVQCNPYTSEAEPAMAAPSYGCSPAFIVYPQQNAQLHYPHPQGAAASPLQYPLQQPPLQYPLQQTPSPIYPPQFAGMEVKLEYPQQQNPAEAKTGSEAGDAGVDEPDSPFNVEAQCPVEPLKPLPAPLQPEKLPGAQMVPNGEALVREFCDTDVKSPPPSAPPAIEDRFEDAPGEAMRMCPECSQTFSADIAESTFEEHMLTHVEGLCPFCQMIANENMDKADFLRHVQNHISEAEEHQNNFD